MKDYIFLDQDIHQLREDIRHSKMDLFQRLDEQCIAYQSVQLETVHPNCSTTYMGMAIANLSLAYTLTKQKHYLEEAKRWMMAVVGYEHWGNAHLVDVDLSASWILFGLSIGYDWLRDDLSGDMILAIKEKLILQSERMYDFKIETEGSGWSTNYWQNHNWINMTGLALSGYALQNEYANAKKWIESAKENFDYIFDVMAKDGSDYEGVVYWRYGAMWLFVYAHLIKERENIDYFKSSDFLKNTFYYRLYQAAPNLEEQINFGDCHDRRSGHSTAIYYKVAAEYHNGHAQKLGNLVRKEFLYKEAALSGVKPGILPEIFFEMIFFDQDVKEEEFDNLPLTRYFEDLGLMVIRDSWALDSLHFSFKCGAPGGQLQWETLWKLKAEKDYDCFGLSHHHPDNNSFIFNGFGKFLAIDEGYNRHVKASDHNTILVDGQGYAFEGQNNVYRHYTQDMVGKIENVQVEDSHIVITGETSKTYDASLEMTRAARSVLYTHKGYFILLDELESSKKHQFTFIFHSDVHPEEKENCYRYENGMAMMDFKQIASEKTRVEYLENNVRAVMTTQEPDKYRETKMKTLHIKTQVPQEKASFMTVLLPYKTGSAPNITMKEIKVENGLGIEIISGTSKEIILMSENANATYENVVYPNNRTLLQYEDDKLKRAFKI